MLGNREISTLPSIDLKPRKRHPKDRRPAKPMPFDVALRKFKKACERAGIVQEVRRREFYEKPTAKRKRKKAEAVARWRKKEKSMQLRPERRWK